MQDGNGVKFGSESEVQWVAYLLQLDADAIKELLAPTPVKREQPKPTEDTTDEAPEDEPADVEKAPEATWTIDNALDMRY